MVLINVNSDSRRKQKPPLLSENPKNLNTEAKFLAIDSVCVAFEYLASP